MSQPLLEVKGLKKYFSVKSGFWGKEKVVRAVDGVHLTVYPGETLSIVGESGCGKSTTGRCILRLIEPTEGEILFQGRDIRALNAAELRAARRDMQLVFQDPFASLNPRKTVGQILLDPLIVHGIGTPAERRKRVEEMIEIVGLTRQHLHRFPHEFSGGQRQRIGIARALILRPKLVVADEPVSALDVSIQAQILNLLKDLQREFQLTYLFISHDLSVVRHISDRVAVMYLGKVVEVADKTVLYERPIHPYTQALLSAVPVPDPTREVKRILLEGDLPSPANPPAGCQFHPRCRHCMEVCRTTVPPLKEAEPGHLVACHLG
ncbi:MULTISPECIES: ABC transporter ATP-binding protein [Bacillales]|mgnify:CR=1 FL=1|uniref:Dipeptide/oligopeptide/nickel ABC transporter ATP-binding protein n=1 Tax=Brevibacillus aydinogluensis TaxID=927786 RepID=A0AA48MCA6_9BACL|nr:MULTISPECIES: dipeptide ABC transporter ATP-binding protein [Bacillales]MDT3414174.1 oligopeptide/dipeptide ABC transporter ATP-binding protein [Brevibacillus aydinogluensis]NNV03727.1 dipeptide ABC transporter ATP-binding protein [Brevibacillus sp. MCWH]REK63403.1 MAG: dipeptide/oligopeptide/nickel ABC transporter ATP-binding protein [Brevibacillus sp.]CAJ1003610.1 Dipeptide/oligopeptide/nickel ABC transporter ATP-binding protein [Brevibacillus aydinogluensis]